MKGDDWVVIVAGGFLLFVMFGSSDVVSGGKKPVPLASPRPAAKGTAPAHPVPPAAIVPALRQTGKAPAAARYAYMEDGFFDDGGGYFDDGYSGDDGFYDDF